MPLVSLKLKPGIVNVQTPTLNELGWAEASNIRFFQGMPQKDAGFVWLIQDVLIGTVKALKAWTALDTTSWLGIGGAERLAVWDGTTVTNISPVGLVVPAQIVSLDNWGEFLMACYSGGPVYVWQPALGGPAVNIATAPQENFFMFVAIQQQMLVCCGTLNASSGDFDPMLIRWSDAGDYEEFTPTVGNQAGSYRLSIGSEIRAALTVAGQNLIWTDVTLYSMQYVQYPLVWGFQPVGLNCGAVGPHAVGILGGVVFWMSRNQFFMLAGGGVQPIECPVWDMVFPNLSEEQLRNTVCETDSFYGEVGWSVRQIDNTFVFVRLQVATGAWTASSYHHHTAWIDQNPFGAPIGGHEDGWVDQHDVGYDADVAAAPWSLTSGIVMISEGDQAMFVREVIPDFETLGTDPAIELTLKFYDYPHSTPRTHGPFSLRNATKAVYPHGRARGVQFIFSGNAEADNLGTFMRLGNIRYRAQPDGRR